LFVGQINQPGYTGDNSLAVAAKLQWPEGLWGDSLGNLFVADRNNFAIRMINQTSSLIYTIAGGGSLTPDILPISAFDVEFLFLLGITGDSNGNLYLNERRSFILKLQPVAARNYMISRIAGNGISTVGYETSGSATSVSIGDVPGLFVNSNGNMFLADQTLNVIQLMYPIQTPTPSFSPSFIATFAPTLPAVVNSVSLFNTVNLQKAWIQCTNPITNAIDSTMVILSTWFYLYIGGGGYRRLLDEGHQGRLQIYFTGANNLGFSFTNGAGTSCTYSATSPTSELVWHHLIISINTDISACFLYIDNVSIGGVSRSGSGSLTFTQGNWGIGAVEDGGNIFQGMLAEFYFAPNQYLTISTQNIREKFIKNNQPVYLGSDGSLPTGSPPLLYFNGLGSNFAVNKGIGLGCTASGTFQVGSSNPGPYSGVTSIPTQSPTFLPTKRPTSQPSRQPTGQPSSQPSAHPSFQPSFFLSSSIEEGLVAFYPFDGGSANDKSGNGNNGFKRGGVSSVSDRFGRSGSAVAFDGASGYIEIPQGNRFNFAVNMSISFWIKPTSASSSDCYILDKSAFSNSFQDSWATYITSLGIHFLYVYSSGLSDQSITTTVFLNTWNHIVIVKRDNSLFSYLNGILATERHHLHSVILRNGNLPFLIGGLNTERTSPASVVGYFYTGMIDEVWIYNRSLSLSDVQLLYRFDNPTGQPSYHPTGQPSPQPSCHPSVQPSSQPSVQPVSFPTSQPSVQPTQQPVSHPSAQPSSQPSVQPVSFPTSQPSVQPTQQPVSHPSAQPSSQPSVQPVSFPTSQPSGQPTQQPVSQPSACPSRRPSSTPSGLPTLQPVGFPTSSPSTSPTRQPTGVPSNNPTDRPSTQPTLCPTTLPTTLPTALPSEQPVGFPTSSPSSPPTRQPTEIPSNSPTKRPSTEPTLPPSTLPTSLPSRQPSALPTGSPTLRPTVQPISSPSGFPTGIPSVSPSGYPSSLPSCSPNGVPSSFPSVFPSVQPYSRPSSHPSSISSDAPLSASSRLPMGFPTALPSTSPSSLPNAVPSGCPSGSPHTAPSAIPILVPTEMPTVSPTVTPSCGPSSSPSSCPSTVPSVSLTVAPSGIPSCFPTVSPTTQPSARRLTRPTAFPTSFPSLSPSVKPLSSPTLYPSCVAFLVPTVVPVSYPSSHPSGQQGVPADIPLPATLLLSIGYSNDGTFMKVFFDSPTNLGGFQLLSSFPCSNVLDFPCSYISKCQWSDTKTLNAYVKTSDECVKPGDTVKLTKEAKIKAACVVNNNNKCSNYDHWPVTNTSALSAEMTVANPLNPILPTIVISIPSKLSWNCSSLIMDLTGSYGNGGRSWRKISIIVGNNANLDLSKLQDFLNHKYQINPPSAILPVYFPLPDVQYSFQVIMCSFLGACSTANKDVLVVSEAIPIVKIISSTPSPLKTTRSQGLSLLSSASISSSCLSSVSSVDKGSMHFNWTTYLLGSGDQRQLQTTIVSTSKDLSRFLLSSYSLQTNRLYEIILTVSSPAGYFQSSSASVQVVVNQGNLVIKVKGGTNERNIRVGETLSFDAVNSYDEDLGEAFHGTEAGLLFEWSCMQLEPVLNRTSCAAVFEKPVQLLSPIVTIQALSSADDSKVHWTLKMLDGSRSRSSSSSIIVSILPLLSPTISLQSNALLGEGSGIMNAGQSLQVTGNINIPTGVKSNATWVVLDSSILSLSTLSVTPVSQQFPSSSSSSESFTMYLVLPANSLSVGFSYTFGLRCQLSFPGKSAVSTITITVNSPPTPGFFSIQPMSGREIIDSFTFLCNQWMDTNLPLSYQFSYLSLSGMKIVIRSSSILSYASSILPGGSKINNGSLTALADIYDSLNANSTSSLVIRVLPSSSLSSSNGGGNVSTSLAATFIASSLSSSARSSASIDDLMKGTAVASYLLNSANCSLSPNCTALNRLSCYSTSHTCGPCLSSSMIGLKGDSNDKCFVTTPLISSISSNSLKKCIGSCSGHGSCNYTSLLLTGNTLSVCYEGDLTCVAICDCQIGYRMSKNCEMKDEEVQIKRKLRDQVVDGIVTIVDHQDANEQSISSWISSINEVSQVSNELSTKSISSILEITNYAIASVQSNGLSSSNSLSNLLNGLNAIAKGMIALSSQDFRTSSSSYSRRRLEEETSGLGGVVMLGTLQDYSSLLADGMLPGQTPVIASQETFNLHIQRLDIFGSIVETHRKLSSSSTSTCNTKITVKIPSTNNQQQSISFPFCGNSSISSSLLLSLISLSSSLYNNPTFISNTASLFLSALPCQESDNCRAEIILEADNSGMMVIAEAKNVTVHCFEDDSRNHTIRCASSSTPSGWKNHTVTCHGKAEIITATCPAVYTFPTCNGLVGETTSDIGCMVVAYTERSITCSCPLIATSSRRLSSPTNQTATTVSINYVAMLKEIEGTFVTTVVSASSLNAHKTEDSWQAILTLGGLICGVLIALFVAYYADKGALTKISIEEKMLLHAKSTQATKATRKKRILSLSSSSSRAAAATEKHHQTASNIAQLAEEALPQILNSQSLSHRMWHEIKRHHRWLGIVYYFSDKFSRILRVVSLATNIIVMLFIQSLTYNLTHGNDGSCETLHTEVSCLSPRSAFGMNGSKCYWVASDTDTEAATAGGGGGSCFFVQPDNSIYVVLFVAIFSALVTTPIALIVDFIINQYLSAPLLTSEDEDQKKNEQRSNSKILSIIPSVGEDIHGGGTGTILENGNRSSQKILITLHDKYHLTEKEKEEFHEKANQELLELKKWLLRYREKTLEKTDWKEFNCKCCLSFIFARLLTVFPSFLLSLIPCLVPKFPNASFLYLALWGLNESGDFKEVHKGVGRKQYCVSKIIENELYDLLYTLEKEILRFQQDMTRSERMKTKRLLFLFQKDLIPGISGEILDSKDQRDHLLLSPVAAWKKGFAWCFLGIANLSMLFYVFLFAVSQDTHYQSAWGQSFAIWLILEVTMVSTMICLFMHVLIPSLIMKDIQKIKGKLRESLLKYYEKIESTKKDHILKNMNNSLLGESRFNAARYLFLSYRLAETFPELKASQVILQYTTVWPRQSYQHVSDISKNYNKKFSTAFSRSVSIILIFFLTSFVSLPLVIQDLLTQIVSTAVFGYLILLHLQLYALIPILVMIPTLFVFLGIHFFLASSSKQEEIDKANLHHLLHPKKKEATSQGEEGVGGEGASMEGMKKQMNLVKPRGVHVTRKQSIQEGIMVMKELEGLKQKEEGSDGRITKKSRFVEEDEAADEDANEDEEVNGRGEEKRPERLSIRVQSIRVSYMCLLCLFFLLYSRYALLLPFLSFSLSLFP
jgi:hypothetical protein